MDTSNINCSVRQDGIACGLPLALLPEGLLYCRRCNAVKVMAEHADASGRKRVRTVLNEDEQASLGLYGPPAPSGLFTAAQALAKGWIHPNSVLGGAVAAHGERWAESLAGGKVSNPQA